MFRVFAFYSARFTGDATPPVATGLVQMAFALQRIGDNG